MSNKASWCEVSIMSPKMEENMEDLAMIILILILVYLLKKDKED